MAAERRFVELKAFSCSAAITRFCLVAFVLWIRRTFYTRPHGFKCVGFIAKYFHSILTGMGRENCKRNLQRIAQILLRIVLILPSSSTGEISDSAGY